MTATGIHPHLTRRSFLAGLGGTVPALAPRARGAGKKPLRGIFVIMATPYDESKAIDYDDLAREVDFLDRCRIHGFVWPQLGSEYVMLTKEERFRGMEVIAKAARGRPQALVFGVQAPNAEGALEYLRHAETLEPDALIAIPPTEAKSLDDFVEYYSRLASATRRPLFMQTTGGARGVEPKIEAMVELSRKHENLGYIKEEYRPIVERMKQLARHRPAVKAIFSGGHGLAMLHEMRLGMDGTMPAAAFADLYPQIWDAWHAGDRAKAREIFTVLTFLLNCDEQIPGTMQYILKKRGVFKTTVSRRSSFSFPPEAVAEIEFAWEAAKPYLKV
jgi:4-hydroxy-tetrahydrodipicolinate synthase